MRDTIELAREAQMPYFWQSGEIAHLEQLKRFEALVRADERAQPAPVQEPEQKPMHPELKKMYEDFFDKCFKETVDLALDTIPPAQRQWVGLSEEEVEAYDSWADFQVGCGRQTLFDMVRDIEAKLKEKNT